MKTALYFPHDCNAQRDPKIVKLVRTFGWEAYGIFWALIEKLYEQGGTLSEDYDLLAYELRTEPSKVQALVHEFELFVSAKGTISSPSVDRRIKERQERIDQGRLSAAKRWDNREPMPPGNGEPMATHRLPNAINKGNKQKKERKKECGGAAARAFDPPTIDQVKAYCQERNNLVDPARFLDFYASKGWMVGKNKMKDWPAAVRGWEKEAGFKPAAASKDKAVKLCQWCGKAEATIEGWGGFVCAACAAKDKELK